MRGINDNDLITEEPCEVKVSSTVLKTNGVGDNLVEFNNITPGQLSLFEYSGTMTYNLLN